MHGFHFQPLYLRYSAYLWKYAFQIKPGIHVKPGIQIKPGIHVYFGQNIVLIAIPHRLIQLHICCRGI